MNEQEITALHAQIAADLKKAISEDRIRVNDAMTLVAHGMQMMNRFKTMTGPEKSKHLLIILEDIAKGPDGVWGTEDDLLSPVVWKGVKLLIDGGMLQAVMNVIDQIKKGTFPSLDDPEVQQLATGCFGLIIDTITRVASPKSKPSTPKGKGPDAFSTF